MTRPLIPELQILLKQAAEHQTARLLDSAPVVRKRRRSTRRGVLLSALVLVLSASALAATHPWSPVLGSPATGRPTNSTSPVPSADAGLLAVLRRPQIPGDRTPAVQATLRSLVAAEEHGVRVGSVRSLGISPADPGHAIVLFSVTHQGLTDGTVPGGANQVCVLFPAVFASETSTVTDRAGRTREVRSYGGEGGAEACGSAQQLRTGSIGEAVRARDGFYVFGLVPDGVRSVRVRLATGQTSAVPARANFYDQLIGGSKPPVGATFTWLDVDGHRVGPVVH